MNRILLAGSLILSTIVLLMLLVPLLIDWNSYRYLLNQSLNNLIGQNVTIEGDIDIVILPIPSVTIGQVRVFADEENRQQIFFAKTIDMRMSLLSLLAGNIAFESLKLQDARFDIIENEDKNYDSFFNILTDKASIELETIFIEGVQITNATIAYHDSRGNRLFELSNIDAVHSADFITGPHRVNGTLSYKEQELDFKIRFFSTQKKSVKIAGMLNLPTTNSTALSVAFDGIARLSEKSALQPWPKFDGKIILRKNGKNKTHSIWRFSQNADIQNVTLRMAIDRNSAKIDQIELALRRNQLIERVKLQGQADMRFTDNLILNADFKLNFFDLNDQVEITENFSKKKIEPKYNTNLDSFKKNQQVYKTQIIKFFDNILNWKKNIQGDAKFQIEKLSIGDRLYENPEIAVKFAEKHTKITFNTLYAKDNQFKVELIKNENQELQAEIDWDSKQLQNDVADFTQLNQEFSSFPYNNLPDEARIKIKTIFENNNWNWQKIALEYGDKIIKFDVKKAEQQNQLDKTILQIKNIELGKWSEITQWLWKYQKKIAIKTKITKSQWQINLDQIRWHENIMPRFEAQLNLAKFNQGIDISIKKARFYDNENNHAELQGQIFLDKRQLNENITKHYYFPKGKIVIKAKKFNWGQYLNKTDFEKIQKFLQNNPLQKINIELKSADAQRQGWFSIAAKAKAFVQNDTEFNLSAYYQSQHQNNKNPEVKISFSAFKMPINEILPEIARKQQSQYVDFNIYINKFYNQPTYNVTLKVRDQYQGYTLKVDVKNTKDLIKSPVAGIINIDNKDPWSKLPLDDSKTETKLKAALYWQNNVLVIKSQQSRIKDIPISFTATFDANGSDSTKKSPYKFDLQVNTEKLLLNEIAHYLMEDKPENNPNEIWQSRKKINYQWLDKIQGNVNIIADKLSLLNENDFTKTRIAIDFSEKGMNTMIVGKYHKGNIKLGVKARNSINGLALNGELQIEQAKPPYLNNATSDLHTTFETRGTSFAAFVGNLVGQGNFNMQNAYIEGIDGDKMGKIGDWLLNKSENEFKTSVEALQGQDYKMQYSTLAGNFSLQNGLLKSANTKIEAPYYNMQGSLLINLQLRQLNANLDLQTKALPSAPFSNITIEGQWNKLNKTVDFGPLLRHYVIVKLEKTLVKTEEELKNLQEDETAEKQIILSD